MFYLIIAFLIQEPISSTVSLGLALNSGVGPTYAFLIYLFCTIFDIVIGYQIGENILHKRKNSKFKIYVDKTILKLFPKDIQLHKEVSLFIFGTLLFPITNILLPSLKISLLRSLIILTLSGIIFFYLPLWAIATGVLDKNSLSTLHLFLIVPFVLLLAYKIYKVLKVVFYKL